MGKGMKAGKLSKEKRDRRRLEREIDEYAQRVERRIVRTAKDSLADEITEELTYRHNVDMISIMFALRDEFGFGRSRLIRTLKKSIEHADRMLEDHADIEEMLEIVKKETGLTEEDLIWSEEVSA